MQTDKLTLLKQYFGHNSFRPGQEKIIDALVNGKDALCIMPTGAGKSVCYQIPAIIKDGITLVISPLISLMKDQVTALVQSGVRAAYLNSSLTAAQYAKALKNAAENTYKIIYVAPERLLTDSFISLCSKIKISMVIVDEAHCISQWGQDFRPSYLKIPEFCALLPSRPVIGAFTATATQSVKEDIVTFLGLKNPLEAATGFDRENLFFSVLRPSNKDSALIRLIGERSESCGIVYCSTRKNVESVCELLNLNGFNATRYHAGLSPEERKQNQEDFVFDRKRIIVATNAFGMGIDKSDVSFVIHYNMPSSVENYYQEAGRAGRDGAKADCILLYSPQDVITNRFLIEHDSDNPDITEVEEALIRQNDLERLKKMTFYCTVPDCLRAYILKYFGETASDYCGFCGNCTANFKTQDITKEANAVLSCIKSTNQYFGIKMICDILRGGKSAKLINLGLDRQSTYGTFSKLSENTVRRIINVLLVNEYIVSDGDRYPVLKLTEKSGDLLYNGKTLTAKIIPDSPPEQRSTKAARKKSKSTLKAERENIDAALFEKLRALRFEIASAESVPAYVVFSDATLIDMCKKKPKTDAEFLNVSGVGLSKLNRYSKRFVAVIKEYD